MDPKGYLKELIKTELTADILRELANELEQDLAVNPGDVTYQIKRQVTIRALRELADHEQQW